jgi:uncharacterized protein (DUF1501 family)
MKRRSFISNTLKSAILPLFIPTGQGALSRAAASFLPSGVCNYQDRVMVIIHLSGANDIINTAVPLSQFDAYVNNRPNIYIPKNNLINLDSRLADTQALGLNPGLQSFKDLYDSGQLSILQRAGYPAPNRSHFTAGDIWSKGIDGNIPFNSEEEGWIGRFLKDRYPSFKGVPFGNEADPLGVMLGDGSSLGFHTTKQHDYHINLSGQDPAGFYNIIASLSGEPLTQFPITEQGDLLKYMSTIEKSTQVYSDRISAIFNAGTNEKIYPSSAIGNQMKTIARFLSGGSTTKVFFARTGGWDTHVNEVTPGDTKTGQHSARLKDLSDSLKVFQEDLAALGIADKVLTVIYSEFGRKIIQNGSYGTDHGTLSSMFLVGKHVKGGVLGQNINLSDKDSQGAPNPLQLENDYRGTFASILQQWLGASNESIKAAFPKTADTILFNKNELVKPAQVVDAACYFKVIPPMTTKIQAQVLLEGFYDPTTNKLTKALNSILPKEQPYDSAPFYYLGAEKTTTFPANAVDWVLCELRTEDTFTVIAQKAVLINENGNLMETDGNLTISFPNTFAAKYHVAIFHRNHLGVITTKTTLADTNTVHIFDLNAPATVLGKNQLKKVDNKYLMFAGDIDQNGNINAQDYSLLRRTMGKPGYLDSDLNGNAKVEATDKILLDANRSVIGNPNLFKKLVAI